MRLHPAPFVLLVVLSAAACSRQRAPEEAPGPAAALSTPDRAQQELDKLQGTWRIESSVFNGIREPDVVKSITIVFQGDKFIVIDRDGNRQEETIKLMPDQN